MLSEELKPYLSGLVQRYEFSLVRGFRLVRVDSDYPFFRLTDDLEVEICLPKRLPRESWRPVILHEFAHALMLEKERDLLFAFIPLRRDELEVLSRVTSPLDALLTLKSLLDVVLIHFVFGLRDEELISAHTELTRETVDRAVRDVMLLTRGLLDEEERESEAEYLALTLPVVWCTCVLAPHEGMEVGGVTLAFSPDKEASIMNVVFGALRILDKTGKFLDRAVRIMVGIERALRGVSGSSWVEVYKRVVSTVVNEELNLTKMGHKLVFETSSVTLQDVGEVRFTRARVEQL